MSDQRSIMRTQIHVLALSMILAAGCGSSVTTGGTSSGSGGGGGGGGNGGSFCPASEPFGGSCAGVPEGLRCTYGDSTRPDCRNDWTCLNGSWTTTKGICIEPPPGNCGASKPVEGTVCGGEGDICTYGTSLCICTSCSVGPCMPPPPTWSCAEPPVTPGCPEVIPNDGSPCTTNGLTCFYGLVCSVAGAKAVCKNGAWLWDQTISCAE